MTESQTTPLAPLRVLVVENDPRWRQDHLNNLRAWGYEAYVAEPAEGASDPFRSLWEDAIAKAKRRRCHIALVDLRLRDDDDPGDTSGLKLVAELAPTVSIIVSGFGDRKTVREALKSPPEVPLRAYDFVGKEDAPESLLKVVEEVQRSIWCRRDIEILWSDGVSHDSLAKSLFPSDDAALLDEVLDLLRLLFPEAKRLRVESTLAPDLGSGYKSRVMLLRIWQNYYREPSLVKVGTARSLLLEVRNYYEHVMQSSRGMATIRKYQGLWDIGGVVYDLFRFSGKVTTFGGTFNRLDGARIGSILNRVADTLEGWQYDQRPLNTPLFDDYLAEDEPELQRLAFEREAVRLPEHDVDLPSPLHWVYTHREHSRCVGTRLAISHGNLHADNILVDEEDRVFLVDFERTGFGHTLRDFAALEADVLIRLLPDVELPLFAELAILIAQTDLSDEIFPNTTLRVRSNAQTRKVLETCYVIRRLAAKVTAGYDPYQYLWALLLTTVKRLVRANRADPEYELTRLETTRLYEKTRLLGAILSYRIEHRQEEWPPANLSQIRRLTKPELKEHEEQATKLRQRLALRELDSQGYGEDVPQSLLWEIAQIRQELGRLGVDS